MTGISLREGGGSVKPGAVECRVWRGVVLRAGCLSAVLLLAAAGLPPAASASDPRPTPRKEQKKASRLVSKQSPPKVTPRVLEKATPDNVSIHVSLGKQRAFLKVGGETAVDTPVSTGKRAGMTPAGSYAILEKSADHSSNIYGNFVSRKTGAVVRGGVSAKIDAAPSGTVFRGAPMKWFMRMTWQGVGMHTGHLPGYPASHGCIRLPEDIAKIFYERVKVGTPVTVGD
jgi:lipoprotein-anchoring transpeptidase ErfK/SrfK